MCDSHVVGDVDEFRVTFQCWRGQFGQQQKALNSSVWSVIWNVIIVTRVVRMEGVNYLHGVILRYNKKQANNMTMLKCTRFSQNTVILVNLDKKNILYG
jgi:hypothetical protein